MYTKEEKDGYNRYLRNCLLDKVDLVYCNALNLRNMSEAEITKWEEYKQKLRDLPESPEWNDNPVVFPELPINQ